ncbi:DNA polymerase/3'-5' exonuclease PolX [Candidatus Woesearchaeota archaeon]|jgi:DNA polymerase (family X)|nr:DNA polymerase/3'-5' exonuclease PolX [Candidatus Woesearchaeota archaeon]
MKNLEIVRILNNIADILELKNVEFKPMAYRKAAQGVEFLSEDIEEVYKRGELQEIPGVGEHIAKKIEEIIKTGKLKYYNKLKKEVKIDIEGLKSIPGLGPKKIIQLYKKLKIKNLKDLEKAIKKNKLQTISGFGKETEKLLLKGIIFIKSQPKRLLYSHAIPIVKEIKETFQKFNFVKRIEVAGSFRRGKETVGDLDFLILSNQPEKVMKLFTSLPDIKQILAKGTTRGSIRLNNGLQIDLRILKEKEFGSALLYFTGNKQHNIELRKIALRKGYTLSEYGLFNLKTKKLIAGKTEEEIYKKLNLQYIPPELRTNLGELQAAQNNSLPKLVTEKDIKGIFHNHTNYSDGNYSILEMAQQAQKLGFKFISFNDHVGDIALANPLDEKRLKKYLQDIEKTKKKLKITLLNGIEIDILKDGTLLLKPTLLKKLDVVIASTHMALKMPQKKMTERICHALENYPINILAHPTTRLINERPPINVNLEKVFQTAKKNNTFLEINGSPKRRDLNSTHIRMAKKIGCKFAISTDAHTLSHIKDDYNYALLEARRGGLETKDIINCWNLSKIKKELEK